MAESIAILFKDVCWEAVSNELSQLSQNEVTGKYYWKYPHANENYTLSLYEYDSWLDECDDVEREQIVKTLGAKPSISLCIELRRTKQLKACDDAEIVCLSLMEKFECIVDDAYDSLWDENQLKKGGFLNAYR